MYIGQLPLKYVNILRNSYIKSISNSYCEKLLGVKIDSQLSFNNHLETIKPVRRYIFWPELHLICVFQKESYYNECFFQGSV